jgi:hypothetical protein
MGYSVPLIIQKDNTKSFIRIEHSDCITPTAIAIGATATTATAAVGTTATLHCCLSPYMKLGTDT